MRGATSNAGSKPASIEPKKTWKPRLPLGRRPVEEQVPARSSKTRVAPAPDAPEHYSMGFGYRLLLLLPVLVVALTGLAGFTSLVWPHREAIWLRIVGLLWAALCSVFLWLSRRRLGRIVMSADIDATEVRFRQWNRKILAVPKRGRVLKKMAATPENPLIELRPAEAADSISFFRHDKAAIAFLTGLERRGVVRGAGGTKLANPLVPR